MKGNKCSIIQLAQKISFIATILLLTVRALFEMGKFESNISNLTIGFVIVILIMFSILKELEQYLILIFDL